ncbi:hypothetical protein [Nostoc sp.]
MPLAGFAYAWWSFAGDRTLGVSDIAFLFRAKSQRSDHLLQIFYTCTM